MRASQNSSVTAKNASPKRFLNAASNPCYGLGAKVKGHCQVSFYFGGKTGFLRVFSFPFISLFFCSFFIFFACILSLFVNLILNILRFSLIFLMPTLFFISNSSVKTGIFSYYLSSSVCLFLLIFMFILSNAVTAFSSSMGYKCEYRFHVRVTSECPSLRAISLILIPALHK